MQRYRLILILGVLLGRPLLTQAFLIDPVMEPLPAQPVHWTIARTNGQVPQQDYTMAVIQNRSDILTGGPLTWGLPLSGISDFTGPDWAQIATFLDSRQGFQAISTQVARYTQHLRPPYALGTAKRIGYPDMVDLRPQHIWLIDTSRVTSSQQGLLQRIAIPEPSTLGLLGLGWVFVQIKYKSNRHGLSKNRFPLPN